VAKNLVQRVMSSSNFSTVDDANCNEFCSRSLNLTNSWTCSHTTYH